MRHGTTRSGYPVTGRGTPTRQDFMWVSGVYRVPPQNRTFVPGYWTRAL